MIDAIIGYDPAENPRHLPPAYTDPADEAREAAESAERSANIAAADDFLSMTEHPGWGHFVANIARNRTAAHNAALKASDIGSLAECRGIVKACAWVEELPEAVRRERDRLAQIERVVDDDGEEREDG